MHTPDGSPCGLLNHLSRSCRIITSTLDVSVLPGLLAQMGMLQSFSTALNGKEHVCIQLDGRILGWATPVVAKHIATMLRIYKTESKHNVPLDLEIGYVPQSKGGQYPGLYLFSTRSRMMRPVKYLYNNRLDQVGSFEQVYMDIAIKPDEIDETLTTHVEYSPTNILSIIANMTPFSDFNQSPRNMYVKAISFTIRAHSLLQVSMSDGKANNGNTCYGSSTSYRQQTIPTPNRTDSSRQTAAV